MPWVGAIVVLLAVLVTAGLVASFIEVAQEQDKREKNRRG
ncbi:hypothetical protein ES703_47520 [subsurface metagenome]